MKNSTLLLFAFFLIQGSYQLNGQEQWAARIIEYSSQYSSSISGAYQVIGPPNAYPEYGESPVAWSPSRTNGGMEYIVVEYARAQNVSQIAIVENFNPGAIHQIYLIDERDKLHKVYESKSIRSAGNEARIFNLDIPATSYKVQGLKLVLNTSEVNGLNQIDAIGISNTEEKIRPKINEVSYNNFQGKAENLGYNVNSQYPDFLPIISPDGQELYFVRKMSPDNIGKDNKDDIYISRKTNSKGWGYAQNIGPPLNNEHHNFVCAVSPDGNKLLLSGTYSASAAKGGVSFSVKDKNGEWSAPVAMTIDDDHNYSKFACFHVSPDWKYLVMALQRKDSYGDMDLYVSKALPGNRWSKPINLGSKINTAGMEPSIFLAADGKTIYFSSNGKPGYGDLDMYMSKRLDDSWTNWTEPVNLGSKINTKGKDVYYTIPASGDYAYFSSERDSYGASDMYRIPLPKEVRPEPVALIKASINQDQTNSNTNKDITIIVNEDQEELYDQVKGYYPVFKQSSQTDESINEDEDDFENIVLKDGNIVAITEQDQKINELRKQLQDLKKEQSSSESAMNSLSDSYVKYEPKSYDTDPIATDEEDFEEVIFTNSLDNRLAELRSQKSALESGERIYQPNRERQVPILKEEQSPYDPSHREYKDKLAELRAQRDAVEFKETSPKKIKNIEYDAEDPRIKYQPKVSEQTQTLTEENKTETKVNVEESRAEKLARLRGEKQKTSAETYEEKLARLRGEPDKVNEEETTTLADTEINVKRDEIKEEFIAQEVDVIEQDDIMLKPDKLEEPTNENQVTAIELEKLEEEQAQLARNTEELSQEKKALQDMIDELERERDRFEQEKANLESERTKIMKDREKQQEDIALLQKEIDQLLSMKGNLKNEIAEAQEQKKAYEELEEEIFLMPLDVGSVIQINNIFFEVNSAYLKNESYVELNKIGAFLKVNENIIIEIGGHTNSVCSEEICNKLSVDRAKSVMEYLIAQGIDNRRLSYKGYGKTQPIASNETINGRKKNQRVELKVIDIE